MNAPHRMTHIELSRLIEDKKLYSKYDNENKCSIFDEDKVIDYLDEIISKGGFLIDFHGSDFFPERYFDTVIVLQCNNE
jgi:adenylate kinase